MASRLLGAALGCGAMGLAARGAVMQGLTELLDGDEEGEGEDSD